MSWHRLNLRMDGPAARASIWHLLWEASVSGERSGEGNAIFLASDGCGGITLYFPPPARLLATAVGARSCGKPQPQELTLLAGPQSAWFVHFGAGNGARTSLAENTRSA